MPVPRLDTIATVGHVFACIQDRRPRGGSGYYNANGHYKPVTNLGWLLRNSNDIHDLWVSTGHYKSLAMGGGPPFGRVNYDGFDAILAARLTVGRVYVCVWQSSELLHDWLVRPKLNGRVVHWECRAFVIDSIDYHDQWRNHALRAQR